MISPIPLPINCAIMGLPAVPVGSPSSEKPNCWESSGAPATKAQQ
ncbi:hypothetical protein XBJ2_160041 [Xenorhabdus bovienii str. Jollieti]|nr:hypothetical protein XBJ2_160041 [Xenorhabdus bovienii str. Jollieti]